MAYSQTHMKPSRPLSSSSPLQAAADASLTPQLLDTLRCMLARSQKLAGALAAASLVPCLLAMLEPAAPILRVKLLEIVRWV